MSRLISLWLAVSLLIAACSAQSCPGTPNLNPIWQGEPTLVSETKNGKLYVAGEGADQVSIVHMWGETPYDWGFAYGSLLKDAISETLGGFLTHVYSQINDYIKWMPADMQAFVDKYGLDAALDLTYYVTKPYTTANWEQEFQGMADGSGADVKLIRRFHMLPELVKAGCSMFAAWGEAVPEDKTVIQLRSLDWDVDGNLQKHPIIGVYHPFNSTYGHPFATVGWAGFVSAVTGMSSSSMAISEKYGEQDLGSSRAGIPFNYLLRDILQYDLTIDDALTRMAEAHRTCSIYVGVGDGKLGYGRVMQYSATTLNIWDDENQPNTSDHPRLDSIVYRGVDQQCFAARLASQSGNLTAENAIQNVIPLSQTGNLHAALYDFAENTMFVANAAADGEPGPLNAFDRQFVKLDMTQVFGEQPPSSSIKAGQVLRRHHAVHKP